MALLGKPIDQAAEQDGTGVTTLVTVGSSNARVHITRGFVSVTQAAAGSTIALDDQTVTVRVR